LPVDFLVTAGQVNDCTQAVALLGERKTGWVLADKGYDSQQILDHIETMGAVAVIPSQSNRKQQRSLSATQPHRTLLLASQALPPLRHTLRKTQNQLQCPRRSRLLLDTPSAICRYCLATML
jgi:transposase